MAKTAKKKTKTPKPTAKAAEVESYKHKEAKRRNIPTAELQKLVPDDDNAIRKLRWPRNPDLDPQLVWRGKDFEPDPLEVQGPPIYIQEKILPRAIARICAGKRRNGVPTTPHSSIFFTILTD
jgi:adenine-specific DNA-methyltransferase